MKLIKFSLLFVTTLLLSQYSIAGDKKGNTSGQPNKISLCHHVGIGNNEAIIVNVPTGNHKGKKKDHPANVHSNAMDMHLEHGDYPAVVNGLPSGPVSDPHLCQEIIIS